MLLATVLKVVLSVLPRFDMAAMAATAMRAAIRPYSMAVAPLVSRIILRMVIMLGLLGLTRYFFVCRPDAFFGQRAWNKPRKLTKIET